ncbi:DUF3515 domain-containing protein [Kutzneria viridogrisea]|uniref:Uncharacterized protein n=2 Tax=Kutzneria TaxID=43356 RepID=W5WRF3_9PSEU|nr:DUF3515 domain-containing protein [Kutzneria albida]AHI00745.1 hypothetical protein KALB_7387 [Kutzneria albida DSM 43870]MBA8926017.1 hypothetical protein [Kutzneria viridogrisea]
MPTTLSKPALAAVIGLPALLAVGVAVLGLVQGAPPPPQTATPTAAADRTGPLPLVPVDAPESGSADCATLVKALPQQVLNGGATVPRRALKDPAPPATVAWGDAQHEPVVLRCGLGKPPELVQTSQLVQTSGVRWLQVTGDSGSVTWYAVDRPVYVALTTPEGTGSGPLQAVSDALRGALPERPVSPNPG